MAELANELMLLERVFLRLGSAETDEQLENALSKFLVPVLQKLSSPHEPVRKKVMELLIHVNKRIKTRPNVQLPVDALLQQYQDPEATSFVTNFTIIYIKSGFPRLPISNQTNLVPTIIVSLKKKPLSHMDSLLLLIVPLLGKVAVPTEPEKIKEVFGLNKNPDVAKYFLDILLEVLLLPYSSLTLQSQESSGGIQVTIPAGMSEVSFKRVTTNSSFRPEEFEGIKLGIVKFISHGIFEPEHVLIHLIVAASDTRFEVANLADMELKKILGFINWSSTQISLPIFELFLGPKKAKKEQQKLPANTRIRLKLLTYLCRVKDEGFLFPYSLQVVFDSLFGENTNGKLKNLALNFAGNMIRYAVGDSLEKISPVLLVGLTKLIKETESEHSGQAYVTIGMLAQKFPQTVFHDVSLMELYFNNLEAANPELKVQIREGLLNLMQAYKFDIFPNEIDKDGRLGILLALIKVKMSSSDSMVRYAGVKTLSAIFPPKYVPAKFVVLLAIGDRDDDVKQEAFKAIYGINRNMSGEIDTNLLPSFDEMARYVYDEAQAIMGDKSKVFNIGNHTLPFSLNVYLEVLLYLRLCYLKTSSLPLTRNSLRHPCEHTPKICQILSEQNTEIVNNFTTMVRQLCLAQPTTDSLGCLIELTGSSPNVIELLRNDLNWIRDQLSNVKEEIREYCAVLYGLALTEIGDVSQGVGYLRDALSKDNLETQHGAMLGIGGVLEEYVLKKRRKGEVFDKTELIKDCVNSIVPFLKNKSPILISGAATSLGQISRVVALPIADGQSSDGSPEAKKLSLGATKLQLVEILQDIMNNGKLSVKVREKAARSLGLLCVGEKSVHTRLVMKGLLGTAKETKDVEVHFTIGESLLMCCQTISSPEARDFWKELPEDYSNNSDDPLIDENLEFVLAELLKLTTQPHPNAKQASCIWLLAILKGCGSRKPIETRVPVIQNTFMNLLCEPNDIVQDVASKGLCLIYDLFKSEDLLAALVNQLTIGTRSVAKVTSDTKLFNEDQLGSTPTGENLTTYKELCSLASDLNKPDLIYQFMHLANHNAIWNSKKGAAFGFSSIAEKCKEDLKRIMPDIVPKLYRYQFDPTPSINASMANIWRVLVTDTQSAIDTYYNEILTDLLNNLNSSQYRVRQSCCLALQDFLKGSPNKSIHDAVDHMDDLWNKLFRVMDDHHEATRLSANKTARILSKVCIRGCDVNQGKAGVKMVEAILPVLLNVGITHKVSEIRIVSLQTVSELINSAGNQVKSFLPKLIPALLQATGELESAKLSYLSTMMGGQTETQEVIDSARASMAKSHFATETVSKSLRYADGTMLEELIPKVLDLMKPSIGLGTRVACAHFITLLVVQLGAELQPFSGKILASLVNGLTDRNSAIRKQNASAIGHLVAVCKDSSLEKLFSKLRTWYFERDDDSVRSAIALTIQSIGVHNQEKIQNYSSTVLPLVFFATHAEKAPETQHTLEIYQEIWSEHSPGTESGIRQNIVPICDMLREALDSPSWTVKAQAANAVATVANKLGTTMEPQYSNSLLSILMSGLKGKTWKGKDKLLKALTSICSNCKEILKTNQTTTPQEITDVLCREARKQEITYKIAALECLGEVVSVLEIDAFESVHEIIKLVLNGEGEKNDEDEEDDATKNRENRITLKIAAYETLGKSWPENNPQTQQKYKNLFLNHCIETFPKVIRPVQISILSTLYNFVNKLYLLQNLGLPDEDKNELKVLVEKLVGLIGNALGITKQTRLRKEALNLVFCLGTKLKENHPENVIILTDMFSAKLDDLSGDTQPEIKCRIQDIKQLLY